MSLDKFIGGKSSKKKTSKKVTNESSDINQSTKNINENEEARREKTIKKSLTEDSMLLEESNLLKNIQQISNIENEELKLHLISEFSDLSKSDLIGILINEIQSSPNYSTNKNLVRLMLEKDNSIQEISIILNITLLEAYILAQEINFNNQ